MTTAYTGPPTTTVCQEIDIMSSAELVTVDNITTTDNDTNNNIDAIRGKYNTKGLRYNIYNDNLEPNYSVSQIMQYIEIKTMFVTLYINIFDDT